jgi:hypothetical protein
MNDNRQIAAAIELKVKQLRSENLSDSALLDQMMGYMPELQALWKRATDKELEALFEEFPHFLHYASLMEKVSEAPRTGVGVPTDAKHLPRLPEQFRQPVQKLLTEGAALESTLLRGIDQVGGVSAVDGDTSELEARFNQWAAAVRGLVARVDGSDLDYQAQQLIRRAFADMVGSIRRIHEAAIASKYQGSHAAPTFGRA